MDSLADDDSQSKRDVHAPRYPARKRLASDLRSPMGATGSGPGNRTLRIRATTQCMPPQGAERSLCVALPRLSVAFCRPRGIRRRLIDDELLTFSVLIAEVSPRSCAAVRHLVKVLGVRLWLGPLRSLEVGSASITRRITVISRVTSGRSRRPRTRHTSAVSPLRQGS